MNSLLLQLVFVVFVADRSTFTRSYVELCHNNWNEVHGCCMSMGMGMGMGDSSARVRFGGGEKELRHVIIGVLGADGGEIRI